MHHELILSFKLPIKVSGWVLFSDPGQQVKVDQIKIVSQCKASDHMIIQQGPLLASELVWSLDEIKLYVATTEN